jgi:FAD/FMN-containing dehydrogenase/Fe-S oxidoreductase
MKSLPTAADLERFVRDLLASGFTGDVETDIAARIVAANDNSIYQLSPLAILYPAELDDINRAVRCVHRHRGSGFSLCARGAGTGTNGQSLSDNLILDCSRHLTRIVEFDADRQIVSVEPGVVLDQLNAFLKPHGLFFPIDISSSSRATLGGMVATDASGKGSLIYGKTSRHVQSLDVVLHDGSDFHARAYSGGELVDLDAQLPDALLPIYRTLAEHEDEIQRVFPDIDRGLSGYDLKNAIAEADRFNPCYLFTGSEGTLAITRRITLKLRKLPTHRMLTVLFYRDFDQGLEHVQQLLECQPAAIEMLDDRLLGMARGDSIWQHVRDLFGNALDGEVKALNYVEHVADSAQELQSQQREVQRVLARSAQDFGVVAQRMELDPAAIASLWELRKRAVGLLGKARHGKRGIAFVEDSAVPARNLVAYIRGFRQVLDRHGLQYGMYGHADAGVLHVRPAMNLQQQSDRALIRDISDAVARLAKDNGGVIWGEHGRGLRGEYTPLFFGNQLYRVLCEIKSRFDPFNLLNPGKLVNPEADIIPLDQVTMRGALEADIEPGLQQQYPGSVACNGNGLCFHWSTAEAMCPSYRATRDKRYSPKGRAALLREWTRLRSTGTDFERLNEVEASLHDSLARCLSCKSCTSSCPLQVDIPDMKSRFLEHTRKHRKRMMSDRVAVHFSALIHWGGKLPRLSNYLLQGWPGKLLEQVTGLTRLPAFSTSGYPEIIAPDRNSAQPSEQAVLIQDDYVDRFDRNVLVAALRLFNRLGLEVSLSPIHANGKTALVKGYRQVFQRHSEKTINLQQNQDLAGKSLISTDCASRLMFSSEYPQALGRPLDINVQSIEARLMEWIDANPVDIQLNEQTKVILLPHCMEQTADPDSPELWKRVFSKLGIELEVIKAGCCGMSGLFGHEKENVELSDQIFALAWGPTLQNLAPEQPVILATGFSCRCQLHNHNWPVRHPVEYLADKLDQSEQE